MIGIAGIIIIVLIIISAYSVIKGGDIMTTLVKLGLLIAIAVVFPLMVGLGVEAFYPTPEMSGKCESKTSYSVKEPTQAEQRAMDKCYEDLEDKNQEHDRNVFFIVTSIGFVTIVVSALFLNESMGPIVPGLIFGGLITILYGTTRGFNAVDKKWLFMELVVVLVGLILVTRRYLQVSAGQSKKIK